MNELIQNSFNVPTMSSREIATLCEKEHRHVCRDIENLNLEYGKLSPPKVGECDFTVNQDFLVVTEKVTMTDAGEKATLIKEYHITLDMAKELAMVERTEKGKQARQYFIECERKLRETQAKLAPKTYVEALRTLADEVEAHEQTKQTLAIAEPKAQYFDKLVERNLLTNFTTTAKEFGIKRKDLIDYLLDNGYIYRDQRGNLLPYAVHVPHLFEVKEYCKDHHSGTQTLITPKGRETLRLLLT